MRPHEAQIARRVDAYVLGVIDGRILANRRAVLACQRHERDLARQGSENFPWVWDAFAAWHAVHHIEKFVHVEGDLAGTPLTLDPWQVFVVASLFGWVHKDTGMRRFRKAFIFVARKNGKSTFVAAICLYMLSLDGEPGAKVFTAATSAEQARVVFEVAAAMAEAADAWRSARQVKVEQHKIRIISDRAAVLKPIATQTKSKDGKNPHFASLDELHEMEDRSMFDSMVSALGARSQPLLVSITTAGWNTAGVCYEQYRYCCQILEQVLVDDSYFALIFEADAKDKPEDETSWPKYNPGLQSGAKSLQYMRDEWSAANASPAAMGEFLRKHLNRWTAVGESAVDIDGLKEAANPALRIEDFASAEGVAGLDVSRKDDLSSLIVVLPREDGKYIAFGWHWCTAKQIAQPGLEHLAGWERDGLLTACPGALINKAAIQEKIRWACGYFNLKHVTFDPHHFEDHAQELLDEGLPMLELRPSRMAMDIPIDTTLGLIEQRDIITNGDPVLLWAASNLIVREGPTFQTMEKPFESAKIDPMAALINAVASLEIELDEEPESHNPYDTGRSASFPC